MSEPTPALAAALAKVQANLPKLERDRTVEVQQKNGGSYEYSYATLPNLTEVVLPLLAENGLSFTAFPGLSTDGKMCLRYHLMHESGEEKTGEFPLSGDGSIQMLGGRITYARRYCLAAVTGIAADEDDESQLAKETAPGTAQRNQRSGRRGSSAQQDGDTTAQRSQQAAPAAAPPLPGEADTVTAPQLQKIATVFGVIGWPDRDDKLRAASTIVGRPLQSSKDLTKKEAHDLIEALEMVAGQSDPAEKLAELLADVKSEEAPQPTT